MSVMKANKQSLDEKTEKTVSASSEIHSLLQAKEYQTGSGTIRYWVDRSAGEQAPWIFFLPGLTADHTLFATQMPHFSGRANCIVWDAPAHRESRPYPLDFTMDDYARFVRDILEMEGATKPVLVGQSLGGYVGQCFMELFPGLAGGFISIDSAPLQRSYMKGWEIWMLKHTKLMYLSIPWKLLVVWACKGVACTQTGQDNMREMMESYSKVEYCSLAAHGYRMLADAIEADRPYHINCPALIMCGEYDQAASTKRYNKVWAERSSLPFIWIPNAGHNSTLDNPSFVNEQIEQFLAQLKVD